MLAANATYAFDTCRIALAMRTGKHYYLWVKRKCPRPREPSKAGVGPETRRLHFTRLANAFSNKLENLKAAVALHFAWYKMARIHRSLRVTPAMAAGLTDRV
jgi:hypothetical protein